LIFGFGKFRYDLEGLVVEVDRAGKIAFRMSVLSLIKELYGVVGGRRGFDMSKNLQRQDRYNANK